jgi:hypothetical protein
MEHTLTMKTSRAIANVDSIVHFHRRSLNLAAAGNPPTLPLNALTAALTKTNYSVIELWASGGALSQILVKTQVAGSIQLSHELGELGHALPERPSRGERQRRLRRQRPTLPHAPRAVRDAR